MSRERQSGLDFKRFNKCLRHCLSLICTSVYKFISPEYPIVLTHGPEVQNPESLRQKIAGEKPKCALLLDQINMMNPGSGMVFNFQNGKLTFTKTPENQIHWTTDIVIQLEWDSTPFYFTGETVPDIYKSRYIEEVLRNEHDLGKYISSEFIEGI